MKQEKNKTTITLVLMIAACVLSSLVQTALNTGISPIMEEMQINASTAQWLTSGYSLMMGITILITAFLIKRFPTRPLFLLSVGIFSGGILLAALAQSFAVLLVGRLIQAAAGGIIASLAQVVILTTVPEEKKGSVMGVFGLAICAAPVLAPTLAGVVIDLAGWHMIFWGCLVLCLLLLAVSALTVGNVLKTEQASFDIVSFVFCAVGYTGVTLALGNIGNNGFVSAQVILPFLLGVAAFAVFVKKQLGMEEPFLEIRIFKDSTFRTAAIACMILYGIMLASGTMIPIYAQSMRGMTATASGLLTMPGSLATAVVSMFAGKWYDRYGVRKIYLIGTLLLVTSSVAFCFLGEDTSGMYIIVANLVRSVGCGMLMMPTITWAMSKLDAKYTSDGTAIIASLRTVAGSLGAAVFTSIMTVAAQNETAVGQIIGVNIAFAVMCVLTAVLFGIAVAKVK